MRKLLVVTVIVQTAVACYSLATFPEFSERSLPPMFWVVCALVYLGPVALAYFFRPWTLALLAGLRALDFTAVPSTFRSTGSALVNNLAFLALSLIVIVLCAIGFIRLRRTHQAETESTNTNCQQ